MQGTGEVMGGAGFVLAEEGELPVGAAVGIGKNSGFEGLGARVRVSLRESLGRCEGSEAGLVEGGGFHVRRTAEAEG